MLRIPCPWCGVRDETEFVYGGEADLVRPAVTCSDEEWAEYLYFRDNRKGEHRERWRHARGCGEWFVAVRDTATHEIAGTHCYDGSPTTTPGTARRPSEAAG